MYWNRLCALWLDNIACVYVCSPPCACTSCGIDQTMCEAPQLLFLAGSRATCHAATSIRYPPSSLFSHIPLWRQQNRCLFGFSVHWAKTLCVHWAKTLCSNIWECSWVSVYLIFCWRVKLCSNRYDSWGWYLSFVIVVQQERIWYSIYDWFYVEWVVLNSWMIYVHMFRTKSDHVSASCTSPRCVCGRGLRATQV